MEVRARSHLKITSHTVKGKEKSRSASHLLLQAAAWQPNLPPRQMLHMTFPL
jgi:hypothetical protein